MNWSSNDKTKKLHRNIPNKNVLTLSSVLELAQMAPIIEVVPRLSESESLPRANLPDQGGFNNSIVHCTMAQALKEFGIKDLVPLLSFS